MHQLRNIFSVNSAPSSLRVQDSWPAQVSLVTWAKKCLQRIQRVLRILIERRMFSTVQPAPQAQAIELHHAQTFSIWIKFCSNFCSKLAPSFKLAPSSNEFWHSMASSGESRNVSQKRVHRILSGCSEFWVKNLIKEFSTCTSSGCNLSSLSFQRFNLPSWDWVCARSSLGMEFVHLCSNTALPTFHSA